MGRTIGQILSGKPVDGRGGMRDRMLTPGEGVSIPGGAAFIVARDLLHPERRTLAELRRHDDGGKFRGERVGEIDDLDIAGGNRAREGDQIGSTHFACAPAHEPSSRSSALGLTASRARMSSATSPTKRSSSPCCSARTTSLARAAGATLGGCTAWYHSVSSGPKKTFRTLTPPCRSSARRDSDADRQAASVAEKAP